MWLLAMPLAAHQQRRQLHLAEVLAMCRRQ
jgi:hypothetical protein